MKKLTIALIFVFAFLLSKAQYVVEDAITLRTYVSTAGAKPLFNVADRQRVLKIVALYTPANDDPANVLKANPFLKDFEPPAALDLQGTEAPNATAIASAAKNGTSIIIDAFARFIVDRIKKELQAAFFQRLYDLMNKPEFSDGRTLFQHTYKTLMSIGDQVYNYELYLTSLRNSFGEDLQVILPNLEVVIRSGRFASFFSAHQELRSICLTSLYFAKGLKSGEHIGSLIEKFNPANPDYVPPSTNYENILIVHSLQFVQEISKSMKASNAGANRYWVNKATLDNLKDEVTLQLYLGLLYERVKNITLGSGANENFGEVLKNAKNKFDQLKNLVENFSNNINDCEDQLAALRNDRSPENYLAYFNAISNVFNGVKDVQPFANIGLPDNLKKLVEQAWKLLDDASFVIDNTINIYGHLNAKKYSLVVVDVRNIYKERFKPDDIDNNHSGEKKQIEKVFDFLLEHGSALAEIAEAQTSKEVYAVIDRIAAPVGSSRVKKENVFSISLNAYGGPFLGKENIENVKDNGFVNNYGLAAPVGLAFSFGRIKADKDNSLHGNKSITLFLSIVDLGAPVSFRFQNDTLDEIPAVKLKDIISPGAHLIWGFGKVPISFTIGAQVGPNLRKVTSQYNEYANSRYWRFSSGLYVDIPVFILHRQKYW